MQCLIMIVFVKVGELCAIKMSKYGLRCEQNEDGSKTCKRYVKKRGEKFATGTDVNLVQDSQTCKVSLIGDINDDDAGAIEQEAKKMESNCRRGF